MSNDGVPSWNNRRWHLSSGTGLDYDAVTPDMVIRCKECGFTANQDEWTCSWLYCEICGDHECINCPECFEAYDGLTTAYETAEVVRVSDDEA